MLLPSKTVKKQQPKKRGIRVLSVSDTSAGASENGDSAGTNATRPDGLEPPREDQMSIDEWEKNAGRILEEEDVEEVAKMVVWCFVSCLRRSRGRNQLRKYRSNGMTYSMISVRHPELGH
jgi:hypothetical protein